MDGFVESEPESVIATEGEDGGGVEGCAKEVVGSM